MNKYTIVAEYPNGQLWIDEIELKLGTEEEAIDQLLVERAGIVLDDINHDLELVVMFAGPCPDIVARRDDW